MGAIRTLDEDIAALWLILCYLGFYLFDIRKSAEGRLTIDH